MYRNVMVPVDGSPFAREAVLQGLRIASECGATLSLVRVGTDPGFSASSADAFPTESVTARETKSAELADLYAVAAECRASSTVTVTASWERGPIVDALIGYAHRNGVDLIVMRSRGRQGIARAWFGSVADGLIRKSGIPVIVVRPPSVSTGLASGFGYRRILVPLDGSVRAEQALEPAVNLARLEDATLTLLLVIGAWKTAQSGQLESNLGPAAAQEVAHGQRYLESLLCSPANRALTVTRRVVISDDVPSAILDVAIAEESDMVALATRGRGGLLRAAGGSVSDEVLRGSVVSTLVVHPELTRLGEGIRASRVRILGHSSPDRKTAAWI